MRRALVTLVSRRVAAFEARPPSRFGAVAWRPASHRSCASSSQGPKTEPDASRGYDVSEYGGLWRTLNELEPKWPSSQSVAVVGPIGRRLRCISIGMCSRRGRKGGDDRGLHTAAISVAVGATTGRVHITRRFVRASQQATRARGRTGSCLARAHTRGKSLCASSSISSIETTCVVTYVS